MLCIVYVDDIGLDIRVHSSVSLFWKKSTFVLISSKLIRNVMNDKYDWLMIFNSNNDSCVLLHKLQKWSWEETSPNMIAHLITAVLIKETIPLVSWVTGTSTLACSITNLKVTFILKVILIGKWMLFLVGNCENWRCHRKVCPTPYIKPQKLEPE